MTKWVGRLQGKFLSPSSKTRWRIQFTLVLLALPVGALMLQFLNSELPQKIDFLKWFYAQVNLEVFLVNIFLGTWPYYLLSWWVHYRIDKKEGINFSWRESWRLKIGLFGGILLTIHFSFKNTWLQLLPFHPNLYLLNYLALFMFFVASIFFTGWVSEMLVRWKKQNSGTD